MKKMILAICLFWAALGHALSFIVVPGGVCVGGGTRVVVAVSTTPAKSILLTAASSQYVDLGNNFQFAPTDAFSISLWVFARSFSSSPAIFSNQSSGNGGYDFYLTTGGQLHLQFFDGHSHNREVRTSASLTTGRWYHVVYTDSGSNGASGKLYVNAVEDTVAVSSTALSSIVYASSTRIGGDSYNEYFDGYIGEVSIWATELNSTQVAAIYNGGRPTNLSGSTGLLSWNLMGNGLGDTTSLVKDQVGSANGTIINGAAYKQFAPFSLTPTFSQEIDRNPNIAVPYQGNLFIPFFDGGFPDAAIPDMQKWSIASPTSPSLNTTLATSYPTNRGPLCFTIGGNGLGYLTFFNPNLTNNVEVIDPSALTVSASISTTLGYMSNVVYVNSTTAYILGNTSDLTAGSAAIVDLTTNTVLSYFTIPKNQSSAGIVGVIVGTRLYVIEYPSATLQVFDISSPRSPVAGTSIALSTTPLTITADPNGQYLYVTEGDSGTGKVEVIAITTPDSPSVAKTLTVDVNPLGPAISTSRRLLIVPAGLGGKLQAISIYDPPNAFVGGSYTFPIDAHGFQIEPTAVTNVDDTLYVAGQSNNDAYGYLDAITL
jgi:hypothetical protein